MRAFLLVVVGIVVVIVCVALFIGQRRPAHFVQPYSAVWEADEDDCAGQSIEDARRIAEEFPDSPCVELVRQWDKK